MATTQHTLSAGHTGKPVQDVVFLRSTGPFGHNNNSTLQTLTNIANHSYSYNTKSNIRQYGTLITILKPNKDPMYPSKPQPQYTNNLYAQ